MSDKSLGEKLNVWVQTIGIVLAGFWAFYTFIYKEFIEPKEAPVNITVDLKIQAMRPERSAIQKGKQLIPVQVNVSAKNPGTREIFLPPNVWVAYGTKIKERTSVEQVPAAFAISANSGLASWDAHVTSQGRTMIGIGRLFDDDSLEPNESIQRTVTFFVDSGDYDLVSVQVYIPSATENNLVDVKWTVRDNLHLDQQLLAVSADKKTEPVSQGEADEKLRAKSGFEISGAVTQISMW